MNLYQLVIPKMGEGILEVQINRWLKKVGEKIELDESLVEISTDKVDSEIPSPIGGTLKKILIEEGTIVKINLPFAILETDKSDNDLKAVFNIRKIEKIDKIINNPLDNIKEHNEKISIKIKPKKNIHSPLITTIANQNNISLEELDSIYGSRVNGKLNRLDILNYINKKNQKKQIECVEFKAIPGHLIQPEDIVIELDRNRSMTAKKMIESNNNIPHVTSFLESDITEIVKLRNSIKDTFSKKYDLSLTFTPIFLWAIAKALKEYKILNSYFVENKIIQKEHINIGMAVSVDENNLAMPIIEKADKLSFLDLVKTSRRLLEKARAKTLEPHSVVGGTYSVSNIGVFGTMMGTPMIVPPQVGVLAIGVISKYLDFDNSKAVVEKYKIIFSHSYDHRVVDGSVGGLFLTKIVDFLEKFVKGYKQKEFIFFE